MTADFKMAKCHTHDSKNTQRTVKIKALKYTLSFAFEMSQSHIEIYISAKCDFVEALAKIPAKKCTKNRTFVLANVLQERQRDG